MIQTGRKRFGAVRWPNRFHIEIPLVHCNTHTEWTLQFYDFQIICLPSRRRLNNGLNQFSGNPLSPTV